MKERLKWLLGFAFRFVVIVAMLLIYFIVAELVGSFFFKGTVSSSSVVDFFNMIISGFIGAVLALFIEDELTALKSSPATAPRTRSNHSKRLRPAGRPRR